MDGMQVKGLGRAGVWESAVEASGFEGLGLRV